MKYYFTFMVAMILALWCFTPMLTYGDTGCQSLYSGRIFFVPNGTYNGQPYYTNDTANPPFSPPADNCYFFDANNTCYAITAGPGHSASAGRLVERMECSIDNLLFLLIIPVTGFSLYSLNNSFKVKRKN